MVLVPGLCLLSGQGSPLVIDCLWPLLAGFNLSVVLCAPVCAVALSQARARLPVAVLRELFARGCRRCGRCGGYRRVDGDSARCPPDLAVTTGT